MRSVTNDTSVREGPDKLSKSRDGLMIESVRIESFRCFESAAIDDLGLINLVVGDNGAGKTSFLEALYFVATNSPEAHAKFLNWRGLLEPSVALSMKRELWASGEFWLDLFHKFDEERRILVDVSGTPERALEIYFREEREDTIGREQKAPVAFKWDADELERPFESIPKFSQGSVDLPTAPGRVISGAFLSDAAGYSDLGSRFSDVAIEKKTHLIKEPICKEFPQVRDLTVEASPTGGNMLYADVVGIPKLLPLPLVSSGIARLAYILSSMAAYPGGAIFIDEFAKGIYHERLPSIWSAIYSLADEVDTQVFLATHSGEAIGAVRELAEDHPDDFRLVGFTRDDEAGSSDANVTHGENLAAAIEFHVDVR